MALGKTQKIVLMTFTCPGGHECELMHVSVWFQELGKFHQCTPEFSIARTVRGNHFYVALLDWRLTWFGLHKLIASLPGTPMRLSFHRGKKCCLTESSWFVALKSTWLGLGSRPRPVTH